MPPSLQTQWPLGALHAGRCRRISWGCEPSAEDCGRGHSCAAERASSDDDAVVSSTCLERSVPASLVDSRIIGARTGDKFQPVIRFSAIFANVSRKIYHRFDYHRFGPAFSEHVDRSLLANVSTGDNFFAQPVINVFNICAWSRGTGLGASDCSPC